MLSFAVPRSFIFRLTLVYAAIVTVTVAALLTVVYTVAVDALGAQLDKDIGAESSSLESVSRLQAPQQFAREIDARSVALTKSQFIYALLDRDKKPLAGSPLSAPAAAGWTSVELQQEPNAAKRLFRLKTTQLENGGILIVGADTDNVSAVKLFFLKTMPLGLAVALLLAFLGATLVSFSYWRRVEVVVDTCERIIKGELQVRAPVTNARDEIDLIAKSMNTMLDRVGQLLEALRQVTNDIAHDLRTPLSHLRQRLERVRLKARSVPDYEIAVDAAIQESDSLLDTFSALLRIAEIESGTQRALFGNVNLAQIISGVVGAYEADAEDKEQHLVADLDQNICVNGESSLLTQLFANLVENAMRHSPNGATIALKLARTPEGRPVATIADNGPGIPEADRARVFGRFVRLEASRTTPGTGLGLSVVAAIADLHFIRITLSDNTPGLRCELVFADVLPPSERTTPVTEFASRNVPRGEQGRAARNGS